MNDETINRIRRYALHNGWSKGRLAREAGLRDTVLRHLDKADWNPTRATVQRLRCAASATRPIMRQQAEREPPPPPSRLVLEKLNGGRPGGTAPTISIGCGGRRNDAHPRHHRARAARRQPRHQERDLWQERIGKTSPLRTLPVDALFIDLEIGDLAVNTRHSTGLKTKETK
jgi:hypothetical protein